MFLKTPREKLGQSSSSQWWISQRNVVFPALYCGFLSSVVQWWSSAVMSSRSDGSVSLWRSSCSLLVKSWWFKGFTWKIQRNVYLTKPLMLMKVILAPTWNYIETLPIDSSLTPVCSPCRRRLGLTWSGRGPRRVSRVMHLPPSRCHCFICSLGCFRQPEPTVLTKFIHLNRHLFSGCLDFFGFVEEFKHF